MTEIRLYNTRTRSKEVFTPIDPANVRMYVCGPTVYDRAHIGNARPVVVFDVLNRLLRHVYGSEHVTYVRNFTDVDDKINARAAESLQPGETLEQAVRRITDETIGWYHEDMDALGALRPDVEPRCTEYIPQMVAMIEDLIAKGNAYAAEGHVLFAVESYGKYGTLSGRSLEDMIAGSRVEVAPYKKNPMDFVLWKPSTPEQPGWDSRWGRGRPGWHIECSAMAKELLGEVFDIHAGGLDLQFPHHENELAQSCCAHDTDRMANWWMHNEMLRVEGKKMSKSLGNFFTVRDLLDQGFSGVGIRFAMMATHYRKPANWQPSEVRSFERKMTNLLGLIEGPLEVLRSRNDYSTLPPPSLDLVDLLSQDLNTYPAVQSFIGRAADLASTSGDEVDQVIADGRFLGFLDGADQPRLPVALSTEELRRDAKISEIQGHLLRLQREAKASKDFSDVDDLKARLTDAGFKIKMGSDFVRLEKTEEFDPVKLEALK